MLRKLIFKLRDYYRNCPNWLLAGLVITVLVAGQTALALHRPFNSDEVAQQVILKQWQQGRHAGVAIGPDNYVDRFGLHLAISVLPLSPYAKLITTVLLLAAITGLVWVWALWLNLEGRHQYKQGLVVSILVLMALYPKFYEVLMNPNVRTVEIGLVFVIFGLLNRWRFKNRAIDWAKLIGLAALTGWLSYNDPYLIYVLLVPLIVLIGIGYLGYQAMKNWLLSRSSFVLASLFFYKFWASIFNHWLRIETVGSIPRFVALTSLIDKVIGYIGSLLLIFNADLFGGLVLSHPVIRGLINCLVMLSLAGFAIWSFKNWSKRTHSQLFTAMTATIVSVIFVLSDLPVGDRYLVILPFCAILAIAFGLDQLTNKRIWTVALGTLALAGLLGLASITRAFSSVKGLPNQTNQSIVSSVQELGLTKGYASYWNSNINSYFSSNKIMFIQTNCEGGKLSFYNWLIDREVLSRSVNESFYLFQDGECTPNDLLSQLGPPSTIKDLNSGYHLAVYPYDIKTKF